MDTDTKTVARGVFHGGVCSACGAGLRMAVTGGLFWNCGTRQTKKGTNQSELCRLRAELEKFKQAAELMRSAMRQKPHMWNVAIDYYDAISKPNKEFTHP
jgi:hypothetical protein